MSALNAGDPVRDATAYRVAQLLQRSRDASAVADASSLRDLTAHIDRFLGHARQAPPVLMEHTVEDGSSNPDSHCAGMGLAQSAGCMRPTMPSSNSDVEVELNVVAGVFEEKDPIAGAAGPSLAPSPSLLLPTAATSAELDRRRAEEAQALLDLMSALTPSAVAEAGNRPLITEGRAGNVCRQNAESDEDSSEVVVMDAHDLDNEETSDDEVPTQRRRIIEEMH